MSGKMKEKKLIVREGETIAPKEVLEEIRNILGATTAVVPKNMVYKDTYFDDDESSLLKQGGSLKIREGVIKFGIKQKSLVMRIRTKHPKKLEVTPWDEAEVPAGGSVKEFSDTFKPLKGFFPEFDFEKINQKPVLVCATIRSEYTVLINQTVYLKLLFDHIEYEADGKEAKDDLLKIRTKTADLKTIEMLYENLVKKFPQYELIFASRYERALEKLSATNS